MRLPSPPLADRPVRSTSARPLLVTADDDLLDAVLRVAATVDVELDVVHAVPLARARWTAAPTVLVGPDLAPVLPELELPRRAGVVLVHSHAGSDEPLAPSPVVWRAALALGVDQVTVLPEGDAVLADALSGAGGPGREATLIGVIGATGGAGASTLAATLAVTASVPGQHVVLVDADRWGGGIDLILGAEDVAGPRWGELSEARGRIGPSTLPDMLPVSDGVHVLSMPRDATPAVPESAVQAVCAGIRRGFDLAVVDLPRHVDPMTSTFLGRLDVAVLLVPARVRAVAAARVLLGRLDEVVGDVRVVLRGPAPGGLDEADVRRALGRPVLATLDSDDGRPLDEERGEPPGRKDRSSGSRVARALLDVMQGSSVAA